MNDETERQPALGCCLVNLFTTIIGTIISIVIILAVIGGIIWLFELLTGSG